MGLAVQVVKKFCPSVGVSIVALGFPVGGVMWIVIEACAGAPSASVATSSIV